MTDTTRCHRCGRPLREEHERCGFCSIVLDRDEGVLLLLVIVLLVIALIIEGNPSP